MEQSELARENHSFFVAQVPNCLFGEDFQRALNSAYVLMDDILADQKAGIKHEVGLNDFCHCGFETGYVGITATAAKVIKDAEVNLFEMASGLYMAFKPGADTGKINDRVTISVKGHNFIFSITDYETDDPDTGWVNCTANPLSVPTGQTMHRRVIIGLAPQ